MAQANGLVDDWESIDDLQLNNQLDQLKSQQMQKQQNGSIPNGNSFMNYEEFRPKILQRPTNQIQILKRPNSGSNLAASNTSPLLVATNTNEKPKHLKTLEQREKEYAEARLRILGSASSEPLEDYSKSVLKPNLTASFSPNASNSYSNLSAQMQLQNAIKLPENVIRNPRGPDGTNGFREIRR